MMDKKSANGFQTKIGEGGVQRKQLPYSVETPYGFHLDLDFLKYVDDIEKGNTIKRVHIQRRVKGPPKFSTLPRNFSLPGHGARPASKEKDSTWSGTSTLGTKPKSRVTEVQQLFDFRAKEGATSSQSIKGATSQGGGYVSAKPREEVGTENTVGNRPNLLRASSMPVTLQQRKGSDSSSPDCTVGTPENGSTENIFRPSPDITERRVPQDRTGLHQQITVALKRVRELEEQVKTIPELKAQICSLREEREKLLLQLQARAKAQISIPPSAIAQSSGVGSHTQQPVHRPSTGLNLALTTQPTGVVEKSRVSQAERESSSAHVKMGELSAQESERLAQPSEQSDKERDTAESLPGHAVQRSQETAGQKVTSLSGANKNTEANTLQGNSERQTPEESDSLNMLQEKLMILEDKLTQASQDLERTNSLLKVQLEENKVKEERILQLSEGVRVEILTPEAHSVSRRESITTGTETEMVGFANQETETVSVVKIDQGTDTDQICVEVCVPTVSTGSMDQITKTIVETHDQVTVTEEEATVVSPPRPRANSMERGTVTEPIATQDQITETPVVERVNQVTETEGETETDHPQRPRASSVDRGTETERVDTVDRVTETEAAQRTDQQTETEIERRLDNNPARDAHTENVATGIVTRDRGADVADVDVVRGRANERQEDERIERESKSVVMKVITESAVAVLSAAQQTMASDTASQNEVCTSALATMGEDNKYGIEGGAALKAKEIVPPKSAVTEVFESTQITVEDVEKRQPVEGEIVCAKVEKTAVLDMVAITAESEAVKTPVRPQRGRKLSAEPAEPAQQSPPQAAPVRPQRGSSENQAQQPKTKPKPEDKVQSALQPEAPSPTAQVSEPQVKQDALLLSQVEEKTQAKIIPRESGEERSLPQLQAETGPSLGLKTQTRPKSIQTQSHSQTSATRRGSKELKALQKGSAASQPPSRGLGDGQTRPARQGSGDVQFQPQGSRRRSSETQPPKKDASELQTPRRGSSETAQPRGSSEAATSRRDTSEAQAARRGSSESPTSPAALGQVVTRLTGLLGEQWAQLGSSAGAQQTAVQQESPVGPPKQTAVKRAEAGKAVTAKATGKAAPTAAAAKPAAKPTGKPASSKMSSIQSQLVSSLSVLSAFYSPSQKAAASSKQQEQAGLKSIMKKKGVADKQGNKGAKKNLKFVGVNGGYETTSSEESSGDEKSKVEAEQEEEEDDSSEPEVDKEPVSAGNPDEAADIQAAGAAASAEAEGAVAAEKEGEIGLMDPQSSRELQEEQAELEKVDKGFIEACLYVKDRMEEVSSPDKEMRQVLVVLYQEWFKVSSQKDSHADTVTLYLRQVGMTTPTLLPYVVNLTDGNGNMALHYSVSHSNFPVVKLLLDTGLCETDNVNKAGYTPVMLAALTAAESPDDLEVAQQLLMRGDVNACSRQAGQTALMLAVSHGRVAMVKLLLNSGADVNAQDREGSTALMCASEHGHTHIARLLLETGRCDTSLVDKNNQTALSVAEGASHQEIVDLLKAQSSAPSSSTDLL